MLTYVIFCCVSYFNASSAFYVLHVYFFLFSLMYVCVCVCVCVCVSTHVFVFWSDGLKVYSLFLIFHCLPLY